MAILEIEQDNTANTNDAASQQTNLASYVSDREIRTFSSHVHWLPPNVSPSCHLLCAGNRSYLTSCPIFSLPLRLLHLTRMARFSKRVRKRLPNLPRSLTWRLGYTASRIVSSPCVWISFRKGGEGIFNSLQIA